MNSRLIIFCIAVICILTLAYFKWPQNGTTRIDPRLVGVGNDSSTTENSNPTFKHDITFTLKLTDVPTEFHRDSALKNIFLMPKFFDGKQMQNFVLINFRPKEAEYFKEHPDRVGWVGLCVVGARERTRGTPGSIDGPADAKRHTFGAACVAKHFGKKTAEEILRNHEDETDPDEQDLFNNAVGVQLAMDNPNAEYSDLWNLVVKAFNDGKLKYKQLPVPRAPIPAPIPTPAPNKPVNEGHPDNHVTHDDKHPEGETKSDPKDQPRIEPRIEPKTEPRSEPEEKPKIEPREPTVLP